MMRKFPQANRCETRQKRVKEGVGARRSTFRTLANAAVVSVVGSVSADPGAIFGASLSLGRSSLPDFGGASAGWHVGHLSGSASVVNSNLAAQANAAADAANGTGEKEPEKAAPTEDAAAPPQVDMRKLIFGEGSGKDNNTANGAVKGAAADFFPQSGPVAKFNAGGLGGLGGLGAAWARRAQLGGGAVAGGGGLGGGGALGGGDLFGKKLSPAKKTDNLALLREDLLKPAALAAGGRATLGGGGDKFLGGGVPAEAGGGGAFAAGVKGAAMGGAPPEAPAAAGAAAGAPAEGAAGAAAPAAVGAAGLAGGPAAGAWGQAAGAAGAGAAGDAAGAGRPPDPAAAAFAAARRAAGPAARPHVLVANARRQRRSPPTPVYCVTAGDRPVKVFEAQNMPNRTVLGKKAVGTFLMLLDKKNGEKGGDSASGRERGRGRQEEGDGKAETKGAAGAEEETKGVAAETPGAPAPEVPVAPAAPGALPPPLLPAPPLAAQFPLPPRAAPAFFADDRRLLRLPAPAAPAPAPPPPPAPPAPVFYVPVGVAQPPPAEPQLLLVQEPPAAPPPQPGLLLQLAPQPAPQPAPQLALQPAPQQALQPAPQAAPAAGDGLLIFPPPPAPLAGDFFGGGGPAAAGDVLLFGAEPPAPAAKALEQLLAAPKPAPAGPDDFNFARTARLAAGAPAGVHCTCCAQRERFASEGREARNVFGARRPRRRNSRRHVCERCARARRRC